MAETNEGWWRQHGLTIAILLAAFSLAIVIRSIFAYQIFQQWGWLYVYGGGSDSYYHSRVMQYIVENHTNLIQDPLLRYPVAPVNPREPLFDWMNGVLGILFQGFFAPSTGQPSAVVAGAFFLSIDAPLWAAFGVFPVYLIGREVSSKRMGLLAAMIYPFMVASIESSALGYANYLTFYAFVMLLTVYAYIRMIKAAGHRRWVASYAVRRWREIPGAIRLMFRYERNALKWAVFTGVCLGALALSWQGYPFFIAALVGFLAVQMVVERIRRIDSFTLYCSTWVVGLVGFPMAMPYFYVQGLDQFTGFFLGWFEIPLLVFFGTLIVLLPFLLLRDQPWVVSVPVLILTVGIALAILDIVDAASFATILSGQGYFSKTLVYSTVAEAQAPSIDSLILGFGILTFFIAFVGLGLYGYKLGRLKFRREHTMFFVFAIISIYLPITAAKFFLLGSAVFALLAGEVLLMILDIAGYGQLRRNVASLADRRSQLTAFRRSIKARHFLVMGLLLLILIPNVWYAIDAGIPYNIKAPYNTQIYDTLPPPLRTSAANSSTFYLGAAGTSLDTPDQYDSASYNWLATQDGNLPPPARPAFVSWWDYGFQAAGQGQHPTVADNFQNGIVPAGAFLLSQNESQAIAVLTVELIAADQVASHNPNFSPGMSALLAQNGVNVDQLRNLMVNTSSDVPLVIDHPNRYLPVDASHLDPVNAMYMASSFYLANTLSLTNMAHLYNSVQSYTGWSTRYAMADSRLFPLSGSQTGIFYAPADLTDRVISGGGVPSAFFNVTIQGSDGNTYPLGSLPPTVSAVHYNINYFAPFYNSMIYRIYMGYNGSDIGQSDGIPGLSGSLTSGYYPQPGWMMQHFQAVYITAFYCPHGTTTNCIAMNQPQAIAMAKRTNGTALTVQSPQGLSNYFGGGNSYLAYYPGQTFLGTVALPNGAPVPNARVTVYDSFHIPHMTTVTSLQGTFSVILPPGNDTVNVTSGTFNGLTQAGGATLKSLPLTVAPAVGYSLNAQPLVQTITLQPSSASGLVYWNNANNTTYVPNVDAVIPGATVNLWGGNMAAFHTRTDASGTYLIPNVPAGTYNLSITYQGSNFSQSAQTLAPGARTNGSFGLDPGTLTGTVTSNATGAAAGATVTLHRQGGATTAIVTDSSGHFTASSLPPGNYSVAATSSVAGLQSVPASFVIGTNGTKVHLNLSLLPVVTVRLTVVSGGTPVANVPVRFTPMVGTTGGPNGTIIVDTGPANSTTFLTAANGTVVAALPAANYSTYALGFVGSSPRAALGTALLNGRTGLVTLPTLGLAPAYPVRGFSGPPSTGVSPNAILVTARTADGRSISGYANLSGNWLLMLPTGSYGLSGVAEGPTGGAAGYAALQALTVAGPMFVNMSLSVATVVSTSVGYASAGKLVTPAEGAVLTVTEEPSGAQLASVANHLGNATLVVPSVLPLGATLCLNVTAAGFAGYEKCGLTPPVLGAMTSIPLSLTPVATTVVVSGVPTGANVVINFTAVAQPAKTVSLAGTGPTFTTSLQPGSYAVTAWAPSPVHQGTYRPPGTVNLTLGLGRTTASLSLAFVHQIPSKGALTLPTTLPANFVSIRLTAPGYSENITGTQFTTSFYAAPGVYTLFAEGSNGNITYANLTRVTVSPTGAVTPRVDLIQPGGLLHGTLVAPNGASLNGTIQVNLTGPSDFTLTTPARGGSFSAVLPQGMTVVPTVNATVASVAPGGVTQYTTYTVVPGATCTQRPNLTACSVPLLAHPLASTVVGALTFGGQLAALPGTITFVGPYPAANATTISVGGAFSVTLRPGVYNIYATSGSGGAMLATVTTRSIAFGPAVPLNLTLAAAWTDTLTLTTTSGGMAPTAAVNFTGPSGARFALPAVPVNTPTTFPLPIGTWFVQARSTAAPYGATTATAGNATVALLMGNAATRIDLVPTLTRQVVVTIQGPTSATIADGGMVAFSFAVRNNGTAPVTFHMVGAPSTWNFTFTPANFTLGVLGANTTANGEVTIRVPYGTATAHPPIALEAVAGASTILGVATPAPVVHIVPRQAVAIGPSTALGSVAPFEARLPFWVQNAGNTNELVTMGVADASRLAGIGWTATVEKGTAPVTGQTLLTQGSNNSFSVLLTSATGSPVPPVSVTVVVQLVNGTMQSSSTVLPVNTLPVSVQNGTISVSGPSVGTPPTYPDWLLITLAFVPTIAVLIGGVTYRWWRSRRWTRR